MADNVIEGHQMVKFAGRKRATYVCSRDKVKTSDGVKLWVLHLPCIPVQGWSLLQEIPWVVKWNCSDEWRGGFSYARPQLD